MLIANAPLRITLGGDGTDLPAYYEYYDGLVISSTLSYYFYTLLTPSKIGDLQILFADYRSLFPNPALSDLVWDGDLSLPQAVTHYFNIKAGLTIFLASQMPPGTGLGLSGSMAVSMIKALAFWCGLDLGAYEVAELASYITIEKMGLPVGKQNPYTAAFGGLNVFSFSKNGVAVQPLKIASGNQELLEKRFMLFFTGVSRNASTILQWQKQACEKGDPAILRRLERIKGLAVEIRESLERGNLDWFGHLLHLNWLEKRQLVVGVTNPFIDECYRVARENGALGGKVTGAGGGGFLLLYCPEDRQPTVELALSKLGLTRCPFVFEERGVQVMKLFPWASQDSMQEEDLIGVHNALV